MIRIPRGTQDILPEDSSKWRYIENQLDKLMKYTIIKKSARRYLKVQICLHVAWVTLQMSYKRNVHF